MELKGIVFDLDGVITQTAKVHFKAWKNTFEEFLAQQGEDYEEFTYEGDYVPFVDGKPRYQGVQSFIESRGYELPFGTADDEAGFNTICAIGNKKNNAFRKVIEEEGVEIYEPAIDFVKKAKEKGLKLSVASSSKNCRFILETTGLIKYFEAVVGGIKSKELDLRGKPNPDIFITAAELMGLKPNECIVVEDAVSGVQAGRNGNFGLVLGVTRTGDKRHLFNNGADIVVEHMDEISFDQIESWFSDGIEQDGWNLIYRAFNAEEERLREALTTTGNGYYGCRGAFEGVKAKDDIFYPGNYIAGLFNKLPTKVHDRDIYNNDFVNCPDWRLIQNKLADEKEFDEFDDHEIIDYQHRLNMQEGIVIRSITYKDEKGRITKIETQRFADMSNPHYGAIKYTITPFNYSGSIILKSSIDGSVINYGVARYRQLNSKHLDVIEKGENDGVLFLHAKTNASGVDIYTHVKNQVTFNAMKEIKQEDETISEYITIDTKEGQSYTLNKFVSVFTSKDRDVDDPKKAARASMQNITSFDDMFANSKAEWHKIWDEVDIKIEGDRFAQKVSRLHIFHLMCTASPHNTKIDASVPARGLTGEAYRGHIFWDELYILPFYYKHYPDISKALLMYRYRRLNDARKYAKKNGYEGAMYPWQTADDGLEETQEVHYNPVSGNWGPDLSRKQRHVSIAVAYNVLEYFEYTEDKNFIQEAGGEMLLEIARFWASIAEYDENDDRYHIRKVMGPDEFHEKYPGKSEEEGGIDDNAYTNIMVSWLFNEIDRIIDVIPEDIKKKVNFSDQEADKWKDIAKKLNVVFNNDGIISQYDGYFDLKELDWEHYIKKYPNYHRMDRILKSVGDSPDYYKVAKQADALMPFYLITPQHVLDVLDNMGYHFDNSIEFLKKNYDYYVNRTSHGSTLSYIVHSYILKYLHLDKKIIWEWFYNALKSDIYDTQGGTTPEGIHCGVMAGTIEIIYDSFAGVNIEGNTIRIDPDMPTHWDSVSLKLLYKGEEYKYTITQEEVIIQAINGGKSVFFIKDKEYIVKTGESITVKYI